MAMASLILLSLLTSDPTVFERPAPLFLGETVERQPLESILITHAGTGVDLGAHEFVYGPEPVQPGDMNLNGAIDANDHLALTHGCMDGPDVDPPTELRRVKDGVILPVACWLADLDGDWDVDLRDYARLQRKKVQTR